MLQAGADSRCVRFVSTSPGTPGGIDRLKAILYKCCRNGSQTENRHAHPDFRAQLLGRISYVRMVDAGRGRKLRALFEQIGW